MPKKITNLVFQGGSVKGVAYVGVLQSLEENGIDMTAVKRVGGTSAGAITACALALGCNAHRAEHLLKKFDFQAVLDERKDSIHTRSKVLESVEKHVQDKSPFFSKIPVKPVIPVLAYRMNEQQGIYEGEYIREWAEQLIQDQVREITNGKQSGEYLTFEELHQLTLDYPGKFRDLSLIGSNFTTGKKMLFDWENPNTKDVIISDAIRISMSIPLLFKPHHIYYKENNERLVDATRDLWVDGGVYDNYPIDCFDLPRYTTTGALSVSDDEKRLYNPETLGFRLVSKEYKDYLEGVGEEPKHSLDNLFKYTNKLFRTRVDLQEERYTYPENIKRTVFIDHKGINGIEFNLSESKQQELILSGKEATKNYLQKNADNLCSETFNY